MRSCFFSLTERRFAPQIGKVERLHITAIAAYEREWKGLEGSTYFGPLFIDYELIAPYARDPNEVVAGVRERVEIYPKKDLPGEIFVQLHGYEQESPGEKLSGDVDTIAELISATVLKRLQDRFNE